MAEVNNAHLIQEAPEDPALRAKLERHGGRAPRIGDTVIFRFHTLYTHQDRPAIILEVRDREHDWEVDLEVFLTPREEKGVGRYHPRVTYGGGTNQWFWRHRYLEQS